MASQTDALNVQHHKLLFASQRSVRYHRERERFLDSVHNLGTLVTAFGGSATVASMLAEFPEIWTLLLAAVTAVAGAHETVFKTALAARRHDALAREFIGLEQDLLRARRDLTHESLLELETRRLDIEAKEPPIYRYLDAVCHDELLIARGLDESHLTNVTRLQRWFRNVWHGPHQIRKGRAQL